MLKINTKLYSFTCANCGKVFDTDADIKQLTEEAKRVHTEKELAQGLAQVCDGCYQVIIKWAGIDKRN